MRQPKRTETAVLSTHPFIRRPSLWFAALTVCISLNARAQQDEGESPRLYDRIWAGAELYSNADTVIQSFSLVGRYHGQYWAVRADQGDAQDWENRRMIFGFNSEWSGNITLQAQMYVNTGEGSIYDGLYVAFIEWSSADTDFTISAGRLDYLFTGLERSTSSKKINSIERGLLVNQLMPAEVVGVHARGKQGRFSYQAGLFSSSIEEEFSDFDTGSAAVIGGAYDTPLFLEEGSLHLDYLYNSSSTEGNAFRPYRNIVSVWHRGERGRLGLGMDLTFADPLETSGHVWGLTVEPTWMLTSELSGHDDPLQLALRYQYAYASEENGLHLQRRYEEKVTEGEGDRYQALYAGLNYYLYGHRLKMMLGGEYARMKDAAGDGGEYRGWTWFGAIRLYF